ncbi:hypothetical protein N9L68_08015, partial [bacterium]|nr:hypothetical protein [bacterium]
SVPRPRISNAPAASSVPQPRMRAQAPVAGSVPRPNMRGPAPAASVVPRSTLGKRSKPAPQPNVVVIPNKRPKTRSRASSAPSSSRLIPSTLTNCFTDRPICEASCS